MNHNLTRYITSKIMRRGLCTNCYSSGVAMSLNEETGLVCCEKCILIKKLKFNF